MQKTCLKAVGTALALLTCAGAAEAADYVVVRSEDPAVTPGERVDAGQKLAVTPGKAVTLLRPSGEMVVLRGGPAGAMAPTLQTRSSDRWVEALALVSTRPTILYGAHRAGLCVIPGSPPALAAILEAAERRGCLDEARRAFGDYLDRLPIPAD